LSPGDSVPLLPGIFHLTLVENTGIAFGLFQQFPSLLFILISVSIVILFIIGYRLCTSHSNLPKRFPVGLALILGGAIGNWIDRLRFHAVIDFFDLRIWPVFNVADSCISIGVFIYLIALVRKK